MPNAAAELYDHDFLLWTREQSKLLREAAERRVNFPLDWENLAEEIESLGKSLRSELRSRLRTIIEHLLKLEHSAAREPRNGWIETVERTRGEAELLLEENPSLRRELADLVDTMFERFAEIAVNDLIRRTEDRYNGARTLRLHFVEHFTVAGRMRPAESGVLTLQKQGKMRWQYEQPAGKLFVVDGKEIYLYTAWDNRVEKMPLRSTEDMRAPLAFLLGHLDLRKEFRDFRTRSAADGQWLDATAKNERVPYERATAMISGKRVSTSTSETKTGCCATHARRAASSS